MIIPARFNGPPGSGNGGYSAGLFSAAAGAHAASVEVTLRLPPPLDTPLSVAEGRIRDLDGRLVAEVARAQEITESVPPVTAAVATEAAAGYPGHVDHPFPTCYVCGPGRADGLGIFPGPVGDGRTAAPWTVPADVSPVTVWAALDCPGGWSVIAAGRPYVLGRLALELRRMPNAGDRCVVMGACAASEGRKALVHSTLYGPDGVELARARATWIALPG